MKVNFKDEIDQYLEDNTTKIDYDIESSIDLISKISLLVDSYKTLESENYKIKELMEDQIIITNKLSLNSKMASNYISTIDGLKLDLRICEDREKKLVGGIISLLDIIDWLFNMAMVFTNDGLRNSIELSQKMLKKELIKLNISNLAAVGDLFNEDFHYCVTYASDSKLSKNQISSVIKQGYTYKGKVIRNAEVIVVKNKED